jgi:hypothetical protein
LANLDFSHAHGLYLTVDSPGGSVNTWYGNGQIGRELGQAAALGRCSSPPFRVGGKTFSAPATS